MKKKFLLITFFIGLYSIFSYFSYYFNYEKGVLSQKIPNRYWVDYGNFNRDKPSISIMEREMNLYLIHNDQLLPLENGKNIYVKEIRGYYYNKNRIIVNVDTENNDLNIEIILKQINTKRSIYAFKEISIIDDNFQYINIGENVLYFELFTILKYISLFCFAISILVFVIYLLVPRKIDW